MGHWRQLYLKEVRLDFREINRIFTIITKSLRREKQDYNLMVLKLLKTC